MANAKFRYLSHTADIEFLAYGKDTKSAIENAALALLSIMLDVRKIKAARAKTSSIRIVEHAETIENLVWFVLQDVLSKRASEYLNAYAFEVDRLIKSGSKFKLSGRLLHKNLEGDHTILDVKAVTPHDLKVFKTKTGCSITVTVDV